MKMPLPLSELPVEGKKVLMRVDFNVPLTQDGQIADDTRIAASLPSMRYVLDNGGSLVLMSHLGRPKGKKVIGLSLAPCAEKLRELLHCPVTLAPDCVGKDVEALAAKLTSGEVLLLENLRFHSAEESPEQDPSFVEMLAKLGDCYVNDAFATAHRAHASTTLLAAYFPGKRAAGFLLEKEILFLSSLLDNPKRPFFALVGGAKISTKIGVLKSLLGKVDKLLIGGGMAYTFLKAQGIPIGNSLCEDSSLFVAKELLDSCRNTPGKLLLPKDFVVVEKIDPSAKFHVVDAKDGIPTGMEGVDIGPETTKWYIDIMGQAKMIFWNGPVGVFECPPFDKGTNAIAQALANIYATTIVGGGDSIAAIQAADVAEKISHISTGGGASLEYLEFGCLPGIEALKEVAHEHSNK